MELYAVFTDFTKPVDTVFCDGLWSLVKKFGCTDKVINLINVLHGGMQAKVVLGKDVSKNFEVTNGVKQGCMLVPILFSLYLLAAMLQRSDLFNHKIPGERDAVCR